MPSRDADAPDAGPAVWEYITPADYRIPSAPVEHTVRVGFTSFWRRLRPKVAPVVHSLEEAPVEELSEERLARFAPAPTWDDAAAAFDLTVDGWIERPAAPPHAVLALGQPHAGRGGMLRVWAAARGWRLVREPSVGEILGRHREWLDELAGDGSPWVLPSLERCFLRHVNGLALVRGLLSRLSGGDLGRGVVGCDTWAWAFLQHQWAGQGFPALVAQAFGPDRLGHWLAGLAARDGHGLQFTEAGSGRPIWTTGDDTPHAAGDFLRSLAVYSRGIPGVAWATWRRSLVGVTRAAAASGSRTVVLVRPWRELRDVSVPAGHPLDTGLVLHALLVHGGLARAVLPLVVPLTDDAIAAVVSRLEASELVTCTGERCEVSALGYPAVRQFVAGRGFLAD